MKYLSIKLTFVFLGIATFAGAQNVITLAGDPTGVASGSTNNATGTTARFTNPYGVVADYFGNVYVADNGNNLVRKIVVATTAVTTLAGSGVAGNNNATGTTATFNGPDGIAADGSGNLYVSDGQGHEIRKIVIASATVTTLAGSPLTTGHADGTGTAATF
ncbi:MAG TPA: hypothetical protein VK890_03940, partial [Bacteroidia bacterium]|nr:hypothetical protein [Bacteroidia bacterium]